MAKFIIEDGQPIVRSDWWIDDFEMRATDLGLTLTQEQIIQAMKEVADCHDAEQGINWATIDYALENQREQQ